MRFRIPNWSHQGRHRRMVWFAGGFTLVVLIGLQISQLQRLWTWISWLFRQRVRFPISTWFNAFSPSLGFASDIIAYQAAIIAIAIPLSLEIISRISERYQSGVITREFNRQWQLKTLLFLVIVDALSGVTLKFFVTGEKVEILVWKFIAWLIFLLFIATNIVLFAFFDNLRQYTTKTQFLLDRLFDDLDRVLRRTTTKRRVSNKQLKVAQEQFVTALEGVGDVLVFEAKKRRNNEPIIESLNRIQNKAQELFALQQSQPERFAKLLYSHDLLQLQEANELAASAEISFSPEKYLVALMAIVNQFLRLREAGLEVKNREIARFATRNIVRLLKNLSQKDNHEQSIDAILRTLADLRYTNQQSQDDLAYTLSIAWYISTVFDFSREFKIKYLGIFDRYFVSCIREIIASSKAQLFEGLVKTLHHSGNLIDHDEYFIEKLQSLLLRLDNESRIEPDRIEQLDQKLSRFELLTQQLRTGEQLNQCLEAFNELKDIFGDHFDPSKQAEAQNQFKEIYNDLVSRFKFNHLIDLIFDAGAYCVFKEHYDYIHYLWTFRQPTDADAEWVGHDIVPSSLQELFNFYFQTSFGERGFSPDWEDHHGSERYHDQYFLLLLLREFLNSRVTTDQARQSLIDGFQLPPGGINPTRLNNIQYRVDRLIPLASELVSRADSFQVLGFDRSQVDDAIQQGVVPFLESLKSKAGAQLEQQVRRQRISTKKVNEFKSEFIEGYNEQASLRHLFKFLELYDYRTADLEDVNLPNFGYKRIHRKGMFFDDWYSNDGHLGHDFGNGLASSEDSRLIVTVAQACSVSAEDSLETVLEDFEGNLDDLLIIGVNISSYVLFNSPDRFEAKETNRNQDINLPGLIGFYIHHEYRIPFFEYFCRVSTESGIPKKAILVLDRNHLGRFVQYSPATADEPYQIEQHFAFRIQAFAEDETLMIETIQAPPDWLSAQGTESEQRAYLESQVLVEVYEKFHLEISSSFVGFLIPEALSGIDQRSATS